MRWGHASPNIEHVFDDRNMPGGGPPQQPGDDRTVRPPRPVWVDLARVYPVGGVARSIPDGWNLQARVPGELSGWMRTTTGHWVAQVRFRIRRGDGSGGGMLHTMWLRPDAVTPRSDAPARKDQHDKPKR